MGLDERRGQLGCDQTAQLLLGRGALHQNAALVDDKPVIPWLRLEVWTVVFLIGPENEAPVRCHCLGPNERLSLIHI